MTEDTTVSSPVSKGWLEDCLVKKWDSKKRWYIRLWIVTLMFLLLIASVLAPKSPGPTLLTLVVLAFAFPPMLNALLQGLTTRGIRVVTVFSILLLLLLGVVALDASGLPAPHWYEWIIGIVTPLAGMALITVPEPTADVDLFGLADQKGKKWFVLGLALALSVAAIWFFVVKPLITS